MANPKFPQQGFAAYLLNTVAIETGALTMFLARWGVLSDDANTNRALMSLR